MPAFQDTALLQQTHPAMGGRFNDPLDVGIPQGGGRHTHRRNPFFSST